MPQILDQDNIPAPWPIGVAKLLESTGQLGGGEERH